MDSDDDSSISGQISALFATCDFLRYIFLTLYRMIFVADATTAAKVQSASSSKIKEVEEMRSLNKLRRGIPRKLGFDSELVLWVLVVGIEEIGEKRDECEWRGEKENGDDKTNNQRDGRKEGGRYIEWGPLLFDWRLPTTL